MKLISITKITCLFSIVFFLIACGSSNVRQQELTMEGQQYFKNNKPNYRITVVKIQSKNEQKALRGGLMSMASVKSFFTDKAQASLVSRGVAARDASAVDLEIELDYSRIFNWGKASSVNSIDYSGSVTLKKNGKTMGTYNVNGKVGDGSILGDWKATLGVKSAKSEPKLFEHIVNKMMTRLPI